MRRRSSHIAWCLAVGVTMIGTTAPMAHAGPQTVAPTVHGESQSAPQSLTTADDLVDGGAEQQRWSSVPNSRIVLNPFLYERPGSELDQSDGPQLPLSAAYYAHDKALKLDNLLQIYSSPGAPPVNEPDPVSATPAKLSRWSTDRVTSQESSGATTVTVTDGNKWGNIYSEPLMIDFDENPEVTIDVGSVTEEWSLKVNNGSWTEDKEIQADTSEEGLLTYNLAELLELTGEQSLTFKLWVTGAQGASAVFESLTYQLPAFPDEGEDIGWADDFDSEDGWASAELRGRNATLTSDGTVGTVTHVADAAYGAVEKNVKIDVSKHHLLSVRTTAASAEWALKLYDFEDENKDFQIQGDTSNTGVITFDLSELTELAGEQEFKLKLFAIGPKGTSVTFDRVSFYARSGTPFLGTADARNYAWHPAALDFDATYDSGTLEGSDIFHDADSFTRTVSSDLEDKVVFAGSYTDALKVNEVDRTLTVAAEDFSYTIALPVEARLRFYKSEADLLYGKNASPEPSRTGFWSASLPGSGEHAVGVGFATNDVGLPDASTASKVSALAASSYDDAQSDREAQTVFWNEYLAKVPVPQDFSIHEVDDLGVSAADVKKMYYQAWIGLELNVLPATPETGNQYAQVGTGKPSMWMKGTPGTKNAASWDSLLGMQNLVHVDPENSWEAFEGMMALLTPEGSLGGESLPSRKAQTAWILYQATGEMDKLESVYEPLVHHLRWERDHLRWILNGSNDIEDERDAEFVVSLIYDLGFASKISTVLEHDADAAEWEKLIETLTGDYEGWFFPEDGTTLQKTFLNGSKSDDAGLTMYVATGLGVPGLGDHYVNELMNRLASEYDVNMPFAGLAEEAIKAPDAQLMAYGLLQRGEYAKAEVLLNSITRDMVRTGWFAEVYQGASDGTLESKPIARGVRPSLFGIAQLIDNVLINNGYQMEAGDPSFIRMPNSQGGVSGLSYLGNRLNVEIDGDAIQLSGTAVEGTDACTEFTAPVGETIELSFDCPADPGAVVPQLSATSKNAAYPDIAEVTVEVTAEDIAPSGTVRVRDGSIELARAQVTSNKSVDLSVPTEELGAGVHQLTLEFEPAAESGVQSGSTEVELQVDKGMTEVMLISANHLVKGAQADLMVALTAVGATAPTGQVEVLVAGESVGSAAVEESEHRYIATIRTAELTSSGDVMLRYSGNQNIAARSYETDAVVTNSVSDIDEEAPDQENPGSGDGSSIDEALTGSLPKTGIDAIGLILLAVATIGVGTLALRGRGRKGVNA